MVILPVKSARYGGRIIMRALIEHVYEMSCAIIAVIEDADFARTQDDLTIDVFD